MKYFKYLIPISPLVIVLGYMIINWNFKKTYQELNDINTVNKNSILGLKQEFEKSKDLVSESKIELNKSNRIDSVFVSNKPDSLRINEIIKKINSLTQLSYASSPETDETKIKYLLQEMENRLRKQEFEQNYIKSLAYELREFQFFINKVKQLEQEIEMLKGETDSLRQKIEDCNCKEKRFRLFDFQRKN